MAIGGGFSGGFANDPQSGVAAPIRLVPDLAWFGKRLGLYFGVAVLTGVMFVAGSFVYSRVTPPPPPQIQLDQLDQTQLKHHPADFFQGLCKKITPPEQWLTTCEKGSPMVMCMERTPSGQWATACNIEGLTKEWMGHD